MIMKDQSTIESTLCQQNSEIKGSWKYSFDGNFFDRIDSEEKAYWLGFMYADGCVYSDGRKIHSITLKLSIKDEEHLFRFKTSLRSNHSIKRRTRISSFPNGSKKELTSSILRITSKKMFLDLVRHGCVPAKSLILKFPENLSPHLINHFVRGYFDGDGSVSMTGRCKQFTLLGTLHILEAIQSLLITHCGVSKTKIHKKNNIFYLSYGGNKNVKKIGHYLYQNATVWLSRKRDVFDFEVPLEGRSGENNPAYDASIYTFENKETSERFQGTQFEFKTKYGLSDASRLIYRHRKTYKGWSLV